MSAGEASTNDEKQNLILSRRTLVGASALIMGAGGEPVQAQVPYVQERRAGSKTLVAFFTRSGNTRVIARSIHRAMGADLFEIKPATEYPEDYYDTVAKAASETARGFEPALADRVPKTAAYEAVYLGFPIWGQTVPPVIRSFLRAHDLREKTVRPFMTHGGFGLGNSLTILKSHIPGARIEKEFSIEADQERRTLEAASTWVGVELR